MTDTPNLLERVRLMFTELEPSFASIDRTVPNTGDWREDVRLMLEENRQLLGCDDTDLPTDPDPLRTAQLRLAESAALIAELERADDG